MKQILGLVLGAGVGALIGFYSRIYGIELGAPIGVVTHEGFVAIAAGIVGAVVGTSVAIRFGADADLDGDRGARVVVGGLGGAATGVIYGALTATIGSSLIMIVLGFTLQESRSEMFAGPLGGLVIGSMMGALVGSILGLVVGAVVGVFISAMGKATPAPKADLARAEKKPSKIKEGKPLPAAVVARGGVPPVNAGRKR